MRGILLKSVLIAASLFGMTAGTNAAISVTAAAGAGPFDFSAGPAGGDWDTASVAGGAGDITTDAALETAAKTTVASAVATALAGDGADPIGTAGLARWMSTTLALGTRPTGNRYTLLKATLRNDEPDVITSLTVSYTLKTNTAAGSVIDEHIYGHQVYYSLSGAAGSWTRITAFNVGNFADPQNLSTVLSVSWQPGTTMFLLWVDDNGPSSGTAPNLEGGYLLDDFRISDVVTMPVVPPVVTQDPAPNTQVAERGTLNLTIVATGATSYQWFRSGNMLTDGTLCADGLDRSIAGATTPSLTVTGVRPGDAGQYRCVASNSAGNDPSADGAVTVQADSTAPRILYATCGANPNEFIVVFSEPMNDGCGLAIGNGPVTDPLNWVIEYVGTPTSQNPSGYTNMGTFAGQTVLGITVSIPHDTPTPVRITWTGDLTDTAALQNVLPAGSVMALCFTNEIMGLGANWKYNDDDVDPGPTWKDVGYIDTGAPWVTGAGPFDCKRDGGIVGPDGLDDCRAMTLYGLGAVGTCLGLQSPVTMTNLITSYFRTHFNFSGVPSSSVLLLNGKVDDGAIVYLNGTEIGRVGVGAGPLTHTTFATRTVGDTDPQDNLLVGAPPSLVNGDNVLAVELHQINITSSDLTMGLRVSRLSSEPPIILTIVNNGNNTVTISWSGGGTLRSTTSITTARPWPVVNGATSPYTTANGGTQRFYEVSNP